MPNRLEGTSWHITYLKSKDERRHKSRCKYHSKNNICRLRGNCRCIGSSHCRDYREKESIRKTETKTMGKESSKRNKKNKVLNKKMDKSFTLDEDYYIGKKIILKNMDNNERLSVEIVAEAEADITMGRITINSPIGREIVGKKKKDRIIIHRDTNYELIYEIVEMS